MNGALDHGIEHRARWGVPKAELDARVGFQEAGHQGRQEIGAQRFVAPDDEIADLVRFEPLDPLFDLLQPGERIVGEAQQRLAGAGQRHARAQAHQEPGAEALFQLLDDRRQAWLAYLETARGC